MAADRRSARQRLAAWVPRWWAGRGGTLGWFLDAALLPAEGIYRAIIGLRNVGYDSGWLRVERVPLPVVSIGNLAVGGAGKTPFAAWIARWFSRSGLRPAIALRGYGEDEILLHRELTPEAPVFAATRRSEAARAAYAAACEVVVLDDGFQHRALARDLDLVLIAVETWQSRRRLLPRGPWREPASALRRADAIVLTRKSASPEQAIAVRAEVARHAQAVPVIDCWIAPASLEPLHGDDRVEIPLASLGGECVLAVAALADPGPFATHLRAAGAVVELAAFRDHHPFTREEAILLARRAAGRKLVMTGKDAVKLRPLLPAGTPAYVLGQNVQILGGEAVLRSLLERLLEPATR